MDQHTALPSIPRILPPRSHTRTPSRSPTRRQFADDLLSDLSPATTLEAFTNPSGKLRASVEAASASERAFGLRATLASKKIQEWVDELTQWPWPAQGGSIGFEMPPPKRRKLSIANPEYEVQQPAEPEYLGSILASEVARYEQRIDEIEGDMEELHVEEIKREVLETHFSPRSRPSSSASTAPPIPGLLASYVKMDDFTAIVTATVLQSLPNLSRLTRLMDVWSIRLDVLRKVPPLLLALDDVEAALRGSWNTLGNLSSNDTSNGQSEEALSRERYIGMRDVLQDKVTTLGQDLDCVLDTLEGRRDTLPEKWLDRMEVIEQDYSEWTVIGDRKVREGEWARQAKARKAEEDARRAREAEEADTARRKAEEIELARKMAQEAQDAEDARRQAEEAEQARQAAELAKLKALQDAQDAENARRQAEEAEQARQAAELAKLKALQEAQDAENARRQAEEAEQARQAAELARKMAQEAQDAEKARRQAEQAAELAKLKALKEVQDAEDAANAKRLVEAAELASLHAELAELKALQEAQTAEKARVLAEEVESARRKAEMEAESAEKARLEAEVKEALENARLQEEVAELERRKAEKDAQYAELTRSEVRKAIKVAEGAGFTHLTAEDDSLDEELALDGAQNTIELQPTSEVISVHAEVESTTERLEQEAPRSQDKDYCEDCEAISLRKAESSQSSRDLNKSEPVSTTSSATSSLSVDAAASLAAILGRKSNPTLVNTLDDAFRPKISRYNNFDGGCSEFSEFSEPAINDSGDPSFPEDDLHDALGIEKSNPEPLLLPLITSLESQDEVQSPSSASSTSRTFKSPITDSDDIGSPFVQTLSQSCHAVLAQGSSSPPIPDSKHPDTDALSSQYRTGDENKAIASEHGVSTSGSNLQGLSDLKLDRTEEAIDSLEWEEPVVVEPTVEPSNQADRAQDIQRSNVELPDSVDSTTYLQQNDLIDDSSSSLTAQPGIRENEPVKRALFSELDEDAITKDEMARPRLSKSHEDLLSSNNSATPRRSVPVLQESPAFFERSFSSSAMSPVVEEDSPLSKLETGDGASESVPRALSEEEIELKELRLPVLPHKNSLTRFNSNDRHSTMSRRESASSDTSTIVNSQIAEPISSPVGSLVLEEDTSFLPDIYEQSPLAGRIRFRGKPYELSPPGSPPRSPMALRQRPSQLDLSESSQADWRDSTPDISTPPSTAIRFTLNQDTEAPPTPRPHSPKKANTDDQIQQQISSLLETIPARFRLTSELESNPFAGETLRPLKTRRSVTSLRSVRSSSSMSNYSTSSRAATPSFTLAPALSKTTQRSRAPSANPEIKVYHLSRSTGEAPIKLFVRLVGEQGERVMVRVGGGWADLGEYLKEYASHHGRRTTAETADKVEIQNLPSRVISTSSVASSSATLRGNGRSSPAPRSVSVMERDRPRSSLLIRKTRRMQGGESETTYSRLSDLRSPSTPLPPANRRPFETPPSAKSIASTSSTSAASGRSSRLSWAEEDSSLGLAGPKSRKVTISERDQEWVDSMKEKVRLASAEKEKREKEKEKEKDRKERTTSFGEMDKVGGTKRLFRKSQGGAGGGSRRGSEA